MIYQVDCSVLLDGEKFKEISLWNMFCRKKIFTILMAVMYGLGLYNIVGGIPKLKIGDTNGFILTSGMGVIMLVITIYMLYSQVSRLNKISKNEEWLGKTAKHFRFTKEMISNYRVEAQEERKYEWNQVQGAYNRKDEVVICTKKDEQVLILDRKKLSEEELKFICDIISEHHLWKTSMNKRGVYSIFIAITILAAMFAVNIFTRM